MPASLIAPFKDSNVCVRYTHWFSFIICTRPMVLLWKKLRLIKFKDATYTTCHIHTYILYTASHLLIYACLVYLHIIYVSLNVYWHSRMSVWPSYSLYRLVARHLPQTQYHRTTTDAGNAAVTHTHRHWNAIQALSSIHAAEICLLYAIRYISYIIYQSTIY